MYTDVAGYWNYGYELFDLRCNTCIYSEMELHYCCLIHLT